jgi:chromosome segregation ATPase
MDDVLVTLNKMQTKNNEYYNRLKKQIGKYKKENKKLIDELNLVKLKYTQETEIIVKLDEKIFDLKNENKKLKEQLEIK